MNVEGRHLPDTVALIYTDPHLGGPKLLELQSLPKHGSRKYGASYKAIAIGTLFGADCVEHDLPVADNSHLKGPMTINGFGDEKCYVLPLWWSK
jgi:hypothetical protein